MVDNEVEDFQGLVAFDDEDEDRPDWNGKSTRITLANVVIHNHKLYGRGDKLTYRASKNDGIWTGPDASAIEDRFINGDVAGTPEQVERETKEQIVVSERGRDDLRPQKDANRLRRDRNFRSLEGDPAELRSKEAAARTNYNAAHAGSEVMATKSDSTKAGK